MKTKIKNVAGIIIVLIILLVFCNFSKDDDSQKEGSEFVLSSPEIGDDSLLPVDYTCDGVSATLSLNWSGASWIAGTISSSASVQLQMLEPMRVVNVLATSGITKPKPGTCVFKFPVMMAVLMLIPLTALHAPNVPEVGI